MRDWHFLRRDDLEDDEGQPHSVFTEGRLNRWLAHPDNRWEALRLYERLTGRASENLSQLTPREFHKFVRPRLEQALSTGELAVVHRKGLPTAPEIKHAWIPLEVEKKEVAPAKASEPPKKEAKEEKVELNWIDIQLVDTKGDPVEGRQCRIKLPDGKIRVQSTGKDGFIRLRNIPEGTCEVTFPDLAPDAWKVA